MAYNNFRVKSPVKSFRDLEVYQQTTALSAEIFNVSLPAKYKNNQDVVKELDKLKEMSKQAPRLIVESYSDKFTNMELAEKKLEMASQTVNLIVAKLDFLNALLDSEKTKEKLFEILRKYQRNRMKIINLKRAWSRVFNKS